MTRMTTYNTRLGICIPTYKRPEQLEKCVESLIAAAAPFEVPIFITDDSADDTNTEVYARLHALYPHISVERNAQNLGIDRNILRCANICDCEYAWLIGEDDRMVPEAVATILPLLDQPEGAPAFIASNYCYVDEKVSLVLRENILGIEQDIQKSSALFFCEEAWAVGFLGGCILSKALWHSVDHEKYVGTYFAHVGIIMAYLKDKDVYLSARSLVKNRIGGAEVMSWSGDAYNVFYGWAKMSRLLVPVYGQETCEKAILNFENRTGINTFRFLMAKRADRQFDAEVYEKFIRNGSQGRLYKCFAYVVARTSPVPFRWLGAIWTFLRSKQRKKSL